MWLQDKVSEMVQNDCDASLLALARGPVSVIKKYDGLIINGYRFHTKQRERLRKTQNNGLMVEADNRQYYGVLTDVIELDYRGVFKVVLFRAEWVDIRNSRGLRVDENGFTLVNLSRLFHTGAFLKDDPYVFSSQAKQVFYMSDPKNNEWSHVINVYPRDLYDIGK